MYRAAGKMIGTIDFTVKTIKKIPSVLAAVILIVLWSYIFAIHFNIHDLSDNAAFHREGAGWVFAFISVFSGNLSGLYRPWRCWLALVLFLGFFALHYLWFPVILNVREFVGLVFWWFIGWIPGMLLRRLILNIYRTLTEDYEEYQVKHSKVSEKREDNESMAETE